MRRRIGLDRRQRPRDTSPHRPRRLRPVELALGALGVFLPQHVEAHLLPGQVGAAVTEARVGLVHGGSLRWTTPKMPHILRRLDIHI